MDWQRISVDAMEEIAEKLSELCDQKETRKIGDSMSLAVNTGVYVGVIKNMGGGCHPILRQVSEHIGKGILSSETTFNEALKVFDLEFDQLGFATTGNCHECLSFENSMEKPMCSTTRILLQYILKGATGKNYSVVEEKCIAKGEDECRFVFSPSRSIKDLLIKPIEYTMNDADKLIKTYFSTFNKVKDVRSPIHLGHMIGASVVRQLGVGRAGSVLRTGAIIVGQNVGRSLEKDPKESISMLADVSNELGLGKVSVDGNTFVVEDCWLCSTIPKTEVDSRYCVWNASFFASALSTATGEDVKVKEIACTKKGNHSCVYGIEMD
ncbi:MAG: V4R domain-containing protein [Candidatus Hydrothermarchaeota archaeon]